MQFSSAGLVAFSLFMMGIIALVSVAAGYSVVSPNSFSGGVNYNVGVFYDSGGHAVCDCNLTALGEEGHVIKVDYGETAAWVNHTGIGLNVPYPLYYDQNGEYPIVYKDIITDTFSGQVPSGFSRYWKDLPTDSGSSLTSTLVSQLMAGLTTIMISILALGLIVGLGVLGIGENPFSVRVVIVTSFFSALYALVSGFGFADLVAVPIFGWLVYLTLTFMYFFGVWGMVNTGGSF